MPRANSSVPRHRRHRKIVKQAKGYYGARSRNFKAAKDAVEKAGLYAYRDRRQKKRQLLMALIGLSRYPKPSPISSTLLPLSIKRTKTLIKLISKQLNEEISNLEASSKKFSELKNSISIETQKIREANKD